MNMINGIKVLNWGTSVLLHVYALGEKHEQLLRYRGTVVIVAQTENTTPVAWGGGGFEWPINENQ